MEIHQGLLNTTGNYTHYLVIAYKGKESEKEWAFQASLAVKSLAANAGDARDMGSIPGWGRSPGGGSVPRRELRSHMLCGHTSPPTKATQRKNKTKHLALAISTVKSLNLLT